MQGISVDNVSTGGFRYQISTFQKYCTVQYTSGSVGRSLATRLDTARLIKSSAMIGRLERHSEETANVADNLGC
jgi:hypothetical protein